MFPYIEFDIMCTYIYKCHTKIWQNYTNTALIPNYKSTDTTVVII